MDWDIPRSALSSFKRLKLIQKCLKFNQASNKSAHASLCLHVIKSIRKIENTTETHKNATQHKEASHFSHHTKYKTHQI